VTTVTVKLH